ncbi:hypothetical protein B7463_g7871, partial [Scytalidium lignicola]
MNVTMLLLFLTAYLMASIAAYPLQSLIHGDPTVSLQDSLHTNITSSSNINEGEISFEKTLLLSSQNQTYTPTDLLNITCTQDGDVLGCLKPGEEVSNGYTSPAGQSRSLELLLTDSATTDVSYPSVADRASESFKRAAPALHRQSAGTSNQVDRTFLSAVLMICGVWGML